MLTVDSGFALTGINRCWRDRCRIRLVKTVEVWSVAF
jgi:hypothetical protein